MKFVDEFREPTAARHLLQRIRKRASQKWNIMEVCGGQTHSLLKYGITRELEDCIELIHGPGCPVCVTSIESIDLAQELAIRDGVTVASFGDMLRVPGSTHSLLQARARGGSVVTVYSPLDAVQLAKTQPDNQIVFLAVGFETTAPATALAIRQAQEQGLTNFSMLVSHVRVLPAMQSLMEKPDSCVQGFLAAGHVCTVMGYRCYEPFVKRFQVPVVVTGFEPLDLLSGLWACVNQLESGSVKVENQYGRGVSREGNVAARRLVEEVYEVCDQDWRGFGTIPAGGFRLRNQYIDFDARRRFNENCSTRFARHDSLTAPPDGNCLSGDVLSGRIKPTDCPAFATICHPNSPLGAPMVSSEGACAAYYSYAKQLDPEATTDLR